MSWISPSNVTHVCTWNNKSFEHTFNIVNLPIYLQQMCIAVCSRYWNTWTWIEQCVLCVETAGVLYVVRMVVLGLRAWCRRAGDRGAALIKALLHISGNPFCCPVTGAGTWKQWFLWNLNFLAFVTERYFTLEPRVFHQFQKLFLVLFYSFVG